MKKKEVLACCCHYCRYWRGWISKFAEISQNLMERPSMKFLYLSWFQVQKIALALLRPGPVEVGCARCQAAHPILCSFVSRDLSFEQCKLDFYTKLPTHTVGLNMCVTLKKMPAQAEHIFDTFEYFWVDHKSKFFRDCLVTRWRHHCFCWKLEFWAEIFFGEFF